MNNRISNHIYVPYGSVTVNNYYYGTPDVSQANVIEDVTPVENTSSFTSETIVPPVGKELDSDIPDSIIFTKKAKQEGKQPHILRSLQKSIDGRRDKTRAFVHELQEWQKEGYVDARFNAQVMYDELDKIMPPTSFSRPADFFSTPPLHDFTNYPIIKISLTKGQVMGK